MFTPMNSRMSRFLWLLSFLLALAAQAAPNNILLIIADDYGVDSSSLYNTNAGAVLPPTPNINSLAAQGMIFRDAYAYPVCSPTRACILTGQYGFRTGVGDVIENSPALSTSLWTLPRALNNAATGHVMAQFGKWHLGGGLNGPQNTGGWTHFSGALFGALANYTNWTKNVNGINMMNYTNYATSDVVDDALTWINAQATNRWFAWVAFNAPHTPLHKPPTHLAPSYASLPGTTTHIKNNPLLYYNAMVEAMDTEIGRLLAAVNLSNTCVIFVGDNGTPENVLQPPYPSGHGKGSLYEGGTKVPLVVAGAPVTSPGQTNDTPVHVVHLFATILELAGTSASAVAPTNVTLDSRSFASALMGGTESDQLVYGEQFGTPAGTKDGRSLRDTRYKLIRLNDGHDEFYDLQTDPAELTDLNSVLTAEQRSYRDRLQFWLYGYTTNSGVNVTAPAAGAGQFSCTLEQVGNYELWRCDDLTAQFWSPVTHAIATTNGTTMTLTDPFAPAEHGFYSVIK